jgi:hypothetical protein
MNSKYSYAACILLPLCGLLPLLDRRHSYGIVAGVWCDEDLTNVIGGDWFFVNALFTFVSIFIMVVLFAIVWYRARQLGKEVIKNVHYGVGGYVFITIIVWIPRVVLYELQYGSDTAAAWAPALAIHLLPDISALFYAVLYFRRRNLLYKFEEAMRGSIKPSVSVDLNWDSYSSHSSSQFGNSFRTSHDRENGGTGVNPIFANLTKAMATQLAPVRKEAAHLTPPRGSDTETEPEESKQDVEGAEEAFPRILGIDSRDFGKQLHLSGDSSLNA